MTIPCLLRGLDEEALRAKMTQAPYAALWARLVARWEEMAVREDVQGGSYWQANLAWPGCTPRIIDAALIHRLTGREDALAYVVEMIDCFLGRYAGVESPQDLMDWSKDRSDASRRPFVLSHSEVALAGDLVRESLPKETREGVCRIMRACVIGFSSFEHTLGGYSAGGNVLGCKNINAGIAALVWGEACGYPGWQDVVWDASETVRQYLRHGCDEAGFSYEGTGYGHSVFLYLYEYAQLLRQCGVRDLFAEEPMLERIPDASRQMLLDDFSFTATTNDHGIAEPWAMPWLLLTSRYYNRPDHMGLWHAFCGPEHPLRPYGDIWPWWATVNTGCKVSGTGQEKPDITLLATFLWWDADAPVQSIETSSHPLAQCGVGTGTATFRSSWKKGGVYAALLGGGRSHTCHGHAHRDCGHFNLSAYGDYLAIDTGRYNFHEDQHNVVMIDGRDAYPTSEEKRMGCDQRSGRLEGFEHTELVDYCKADAAHMKNCRWADRHFFFIRCGERDAYVVTLDNINPDTTDLHSYWWQMQVNPEAQIALTGDATACVSGPNARLDVTFFMKNEPAPAGVETRLELRQDVQEWVWPYGREQDVSTFEKTGLLVSSLRRPRLLAIHHDIACCLGAVISPCRKDAPARTVRQFGEGNMIGLEIHGGDYVDTLLLPLDHAYINTPEYYGLCEFALVRRNAAGEVVDQWVKDGGFMMLK